MSHNLQSLLFTQQVSPGSPQENEFHDNNSRSRQGSISVGLRRRSRPNLPSIFPAPNLNHRLQHIESSASGITSLNLLAKTPLSARTPGTATSASSAMSICDTTTPDMSCSSPLTTSLVADLSINLHIAQTPHIPTPRRALFPIQSRSFQSHGAGGGGGGGGGTGGGGGGGCGGDSSIVRCLSNTPSFRNTKNPRRTPIKFASFAGSTATSTIMSHSVSTPLSPLAWSHPMQRSNTIRIDEEDENDLDTQDNGPNKENFVGTTPPDKNLNIRLPRANVKASKISKTRKQNQNQLFKTPSLARFSRVRRTHSMFESPKVFLNQELCEEKQVMETVVATQQSPTIIDDDSQSFLSSSSCLIQSHIVDQDPFRRIKRETLCDLLDGKFAQSYDRLVLIDCRFEYEYEGGHIDGAININSKVQLEDQLLSPLLSRETDHEERLLLVFHCEYSAHRGPRMAMHLRNRDRQVNMKRYPKLYYPDIAILEGGYAHFFEQYYERCVPQCYIEMNDSSHQRTCERELHRFKRNMRQPVRRGLLQRESPERVPQAPPHAFNDPSMTPTGPARRITSMNY